MDRNIYVITETKLVCNLVIFIMILFLNSYTAADINIKKTWTIGDLTKAFEYPDFAKENITFCSVKPEDVLSVLENMSGSGIERLYLSIKQPLQFHKELDLSPIERMTSLRWLWIAAESSDISRENSVVIKFNSNQTGALPLTRLHINIPIYGETNVFNLIKRLQNLEILDLSNTLTLFRNGLLDNIINALNGKPLKGLSLKKFQVISLDYAIQRLNITQLLWPIRNCNLLYLDLSENDILTIAPGFYHITKNVRYFDLSHNNMVNNKVPTTLIEVLLHHNIEVFKFDYQGRGDIQTTHTLPKEILPSTRVVGTFDNALKYNYGNNKHDHLARKFRIKEPSSPTAKIFRQIKHDHEESNNKKTQQNTPCSIGPPSVQKCCSKLKLTSLDLLSNKTDFCSVLHCAVESLQGIPCEILPSFLDITKLFDRNCAYHLRVPISYNLTTIGLSHINTFARSIHHNKNTSFCFTENNLRKVDFSGNRRFSADIYFEEIIKYFSIKGIDSIEVLDLSDNKLNIMLESAAMLTSLTHLKQINLSGNLVSFTPESRLCVTGNMFTEALDISRNGLQTIPNSFLEKCEHLQSLDVSQNKIRNLSLNFHDMSTPKFLNFSYNNMSSLNKDMRNNLEKLAARIHIVVDLTGNPLACGCSQEELDTVKLIQSSESSNITFYGVDNYVCFVKFKSILLKNADIKAIHKMCFPSYFYTILFTTIANVSVVLFITSLCLLHKFRYRIYTCCFRFYNNCQTEPEITNKERKLVNFKYDAFISYSAADRFWVHSILMSELENKYGFKLCIHYRDFPAHGDIADVIVDHIKKSKSIIVILSEYSLHSEWCDFELKNAHTQSLIFHKPFIVIKMGKLPRRLVYGLVEHLLSSQVYIEWPDDDVSDIDGNQMDRVNNKQQKLLKQKQELFWEKIVKEIYGHSYCQCLKYCCCCKINKEIRVALLDDQDESFY